jgi:hypothetical protein
MQQVAGILPQKKNTPSHVKEEKQKLVSSSNISKEKTPFQLECEKGIPASEVFDKLLKKLSSLDWKK